MPDASLLPARIATPALLVVFAGFAAWYMRERLTLDFLWAGLCLVGAAFFMFRG
ncbi:MAG: putative er of superfamily, partial [Planctomycetota bacterium]